MIALAAAPAQAQLSRTFVSAAVGNDANDCNRPTPCRTFQAAHDKTNSDGEITVLDTGGYGAVTITKSISIVSEVGEASILVSGGATGITVSAGGASYVNLRGLTIQGIGFGGGTGLKLTSAFALTITNCMFRNHTHEGMRLSPESDSRISISNSLVADNGSSAIFVLPSGSGAVRVSVSRVEMYHNSFSGLQLDTSTMSGGSLYGVAADTVASENLGPGFTVFGTGTTPARLLVARSVSANNQYGLFSDRFGAADPTVMYVGQSVITGNRFSWANLAPLFSYGDNDINGNDDGDPGPPLTGKK
jgi:hypothetical protein